MAGKNEESQQSGASEDDEQQSEAMERQSASPDVVYEAIRLEGEEELQRPSAALFWSGLAAGLAMGFSFLAQALLQAAIPPAPWRHAVAVLGYTVGFIFVVMGRQQLFTENTLTPVLPLLRDVTKLPNVLRLWGIVLVANLLGGALFAWVLGHTELVGADVHAELRAMAHEVVAPRAAVIFLRAIYAGWLVALMVWLLPGAESARLAAIVVPTYLIALAHFAHSIAGSVDVFYLVLGAQASWGDYIHFFVPTLLGNVLGGVTLVALLNHGQVKAGEGGGG
ncbi:formate/nitrite transporter [Gemmatirosa kalamazoonensis]|uniref:Formate/nitrite transporter n=1 Tax=Gemmatirosa kalamazoonensis TaxID=861299 RepID=W0RFX2_9BACT|nr:formate/nitrite transporter family protein [Gemmatirosa kalamazoonensis]AHG89332.1 formate/nitrite transporter [Gemmatirosa kalamazoonensis]